MCSGARETHMNTHTSAWCEAIYSEGVKHLGKERNHLSCNSITKVCSLDLYGRPNTHVNLSCPQCHTFQPSLLQRKWPIFKHHLDFFIIEHKSRLNIESYSSLENEFPKLCHGHVAQKDYQRNLIGPQTS